MKKVLKKTIMVMMAVMLLCGCGKNVQSGSAASEPEEPVVGDIVTTEVESVSIRFYPGYNIATGNVISDTVPCHTVEVSGNELAKLSAILPGLTKVSADHDSEEFGHIIYDHLNDKYELTVNDDLVLTIGEEFGIITSSGEAFKVPAELFDTVYTVAEEYCKTLIYSTLDAEQITVTDMDGKKLEITDPDQLKELLSIEYYTINGGDEMFADEKIAYTLDLHNGERLEIFYAGVIGRYCHADGSIEYINIQGMEDTLNCIFSE